VHDTNLRRARMRAAAEAPGQVAIPAESRRGTIALGSVAALLLAGCSAGLGEPPASSTTGPAIDDTASEDAGTRIGTPPPGGQRTDEEASVPKDPTGATASTGPPGGAAAPTLTEQDSGAQVSLAVGQEQPLRLGSAWSWSEPVVDGEALAVTPVEFLVDPGYVEWLVTGARAGTATLEVVGEPGCGDTTVCPRTTVTLTVEVMG